VDFLPELLLRSLLPSSLLVLLPFGVFGFSFLPSRGRFDLTMSLRPKRRKCRCCSEFFFPDYRNQDRQHYCGKAACQHASKLASQRRWSRKPTNRDYFRDPENARRVRDWRKAHPGYWKRKTPRSDSNQAAQPQQVNPVQSSCNVPGSPLGTLQDFCLANEPGFIGLLSMITGRTLQEDIAPIARRVVEQGQYILGLTFPEQRNNQKSCPVHDHQASAASGAAAADSAKL
jgi:hypothetical protein